MEFGGSHAGCTHPALLPAPTSRDRGWERGPGEKPRAKAKRGRGARPNGTSLPRQAAAGSARGSWGCRQHGQMATSCPSSLRVSFTDLLSLSHCPSNDSGAELPLCRARHESHPNGILVTAGIAPGSQVRPALLPLPPTLAGSSGAGQQMENPVGHLWGQAWGCGDVLTRPRCLLGCGGAGAAAGGPRGSQVPSPAAVPGVSAMGRSQAVRDPCRAQKAPFLMQKMPVSGRGPREALRVGSSSDALRASSPTSRCLAIGRVLPPLPRQHKDACMAGSRRDTSGSLCPWGQRVSLPVMKSSIASCPRSGPPQAACGNGFVQQGGNGEGCVCVCVSFHQVTRFAGTAARAAELTDSQRLPRTQQDHGTPDAFQRASLAAEVSHRASDAGAEPASPRPPFHPAGEAPAHIALPGMGTHGEEPGLACSQRRRQQAQPGAHGRRSWRWRLRHL